MSASACLESEDMSYFTPAKRLSMRAVNFFISRPSQCVLAKKLSLTPLNTFLFR